MNLHWPQYTWIALASISLFLSALMDGKPKTGKNSLAVAMLGTAVSAWLMWCGGFFG